MPFGGALTAGIGAAGSIFGGILGGSASSKAAAQYAAALQGAEQMLSNQEDTGLGNFAPYLSAGRQATTSLSSLLGTPGQGLLTPWTRQFQAPTAAQAAQTPGYQFQLQQGENALQNSAAGKGSLLTGRTMADLNNYAQGVASTNYQNTFQNALTQYNSAYQTFQNNQNNTYSRLMGLSGQGLQAAGGAANFMSGIGGDLASLMAGAGAARAGGTIGAANAYGGIAGGVTNSLQNYMLMKQLQGGGSGSIDNSSAGQPDPTWGGDAAMPYGGGGMPSTDPSTGLPWQMPYLPPSVPMQGLQ